MAPGANIWLVDDDRALRGLLCKMLAGAGFQVDDFAAAPGPVAGDQHAAGSVLDTIDDGEYEWNFEWKDVWRKNRVSRVHLDALKSDLHYTYTHTGTPEDQDARLATLAIEAKVAGMAGKESPLARFYHDLLTRYDADGAVTQ